MAGMIRKSMVMTAILAIALTGFVGLLYAAEPPVDDPVFTVTDTFAPFNDGNAYLGDTFNFTVAPYAAPLNNSNVSVEITIGTLPAADMTWNVDIDMWVYEFTTLDVAMVGTHDVLINATATNTTGIWNNTMTTITIWQPVMLKTGYVTPTLVEDTTFTWNLSDAFVPLIDQSDAALTFAVGTEGFPAGWTFTTVMEGIYTHWNVTPPANFNGFVLVNVTATDANDVSAFNIFNLTVTAVNDVPTIQGLQVGTDLLVINTWNNGNTTNPDNRTAINVTLDEDSFLNFTVKANDIETAIEDLTYDYVKETEADPYAVALTEYKNETNVTFTVPYNFTVTPDANANGNFWGMFNVTDGALWANVMVQFIVTPVNDLPVVGVITIAPLTGVKTGQDVTLSIPAPTDVDGDALNITWKDGTAVLGYTASITTKFTTAANHSISVTVDDLAGGVVTKTSYVIVGAASSGPTINKVEVSKATIKVGDELTLSVNATGEGTITVWWTNDKDSAFNKTGNPLKVTDLKEGKYTFTAHVQDANGIKTGTVQVTVEAEDDGDNMMTIIIIVIAIIAILAILIILFFVLRGGKEEEEAPVTTEETTEAPSEEEAPVTEETPEETVPGEETPAETPEEVGEEVPAPPAPPQ